MNFHRSIIGHNAMRNVDSVLQINKQELVTPASEIAPMAAHLQSNFALERFMTVLWYAFLLQLVVLACDHSSNPWELASKMGEHHCSYHVDRHEGVMGYSMATAHDVVAAIHTEVENFKGELIQLCPESSAEKALLTGLLPHVATTMDRQ